MAWFADLAGRAENLLNNLDEQTGAALRSHNVTKPRIYNKQELAFSDTNGQTKQRPSARSPRKLSHSSETRTNYALNNPVQYNRRNSPPSKLQINIPNTNQGGQNFNNVRAKKTLCKPSSQLYDIENCPKTLLNVEDSETTMEQTGLRKRRNSLPSDLEIIKRENMTFKMQNLEVENAMLKNELNVMNQEVADMLDRLHKTEDGNNIVSSYQELGKTRTKLEICIEKNDQGTLSSQLQELKNKINELTTEEVVKYKEQTEALEKDVDLLKQRNKELEESANLQNEKLKENSTIILKLETDLRHNQSVISDLQNDLEKSRAECIRLEKDWETYKLRVKSMLQTKDIEIKKLQEGTYFTEDTKMLVSQLEDLKNEREDLSEAVSSMRDECSSMRHHIEQLESRNNSAERVVSALRDALKEERAARNKAESHCLAVGKELKTIQMETNQTIANLQAALLEKENEVSNLRETMSSMIHSTNNSTLALNVADYDTMQASIDNDKIQYLTEMLVQKQERIDKLLADNNMLKIQLNKLETKYKAEMTANRSNVHSVVHVQDGDGRPRSRNNKAGSVLSVFSVRMGVWLKRYPVFRVFVVVYMICLHFWVMTVLFTSTPEDFTKKPTKS